PPWAVIRSGCLHVLLDVLFCAIVAAALVSMFPHRRFISPQPMRGGGCFSDSKGLRLAWPYTVQYCGCVYDCERSPQSKSSPSNSLGPALSSSSVSAAAKAWRAGSYLSAFHGSG